MKRTSIIRAIIALLLVSISTPAQSEKHSLTIHVTDLVDGLVPTASALLLSSDRVTESKADSSADIHFTDVPPGAYELEVSAPGFAKTTVKNVLVPQTESNPLEVTLRVANQPDHCGFVNTVDYAPLRPGAALSGRVVNSDSNKAVAKAWVDILPADQADPIASTRSDRQGTFHFTTLQPGRYKVQVSKDSYWLSSIDSFFITQENTTMLTIGLDKRGHIHVCQ